MLRLDAESEAHVLTLDRGSIPASPISPRLPQVRECGDARRCRGTPSRFFLFHPRSTTTDHFFLVKSSNPNS